MGTTPSAVSEMTANDFAIIMIDISDPLHRRIDAAREVGEMITTARTSKILSSERFATVCNVFTTELYRFADASWLSWAKPFDSTWHDNFSMVHDALEPDFSPPMVPQLVMVLFGVLCNYIEAPYDDGSRRLAMRRLIDLQATWSALPASSVKERVDSLEHAYASLISPQWLMWPCWYQSEWASIRALMPAPVLQAEVRLTPSHLALPVPPGLTAPSASTPMLLRASSSSVTPMPGLSGFHMSHVASSSSSSPALFPDRLPPLSNPTTPSSALQSLPESTSPGASSQPATTANPFVRIWNVNPKSKAPSAIDRRIDFEMPAIPSWTAIRDFWQARTSAPPVAPRHSHYDALDPPQPLPAALVAHALPLPALDAPGLHDAFYAQRQEMDTSDTEDGPEDFGLIGFANAERCRLKSVFFMGESKYVPSMVEGETDDSEDEWPEGIQHVRKAGNTVDSSVYHDAAKRCIACHHDNVTCTYYSECPTGHMPSGARCLEARALKGMYRNNAEPPAEPSLKRERSPGPSTALKRGRGRTGPNVVKNEPGVSPSASSSPEKGKGRSLPRSAASGWSSMVPPPVPSSSTQIAAPLPGELVSVVLFGVYPPCVNYLIPSEVEAYTDYCCLSQQIRTGILGIEALEARYLHFVHTQNRKYDTQEGFLTKQGILTGTTIVAIADVDKPIWKRFHGLQEERLGTRPGDNAKCRLSGAKVWPA
ncbi:hypothetical protein FISHEDRAFT_74284 [Fistulina hepatica ATCC 64428]|uniref:Uncharacterized protein n=1 Tax=Fistulina hepatica ATCC 64428 TaxID=1128425 RepID=A0A0D7ABF5_9AGAR|nr:hypothetical protein FISHEDRAFT_74284 [Fistulina hepatica ATCC 64428]